MKYYIIISEISYYSEKEFKSILVLKNKNKAIQVINDLEEIRKKIDEIWKDDEEERSEREKLTGIYLDQRIELKKLETRKLKAESLYSNFFEKLCCETEQILKFMNEPPYEYDAIFSIHEIDMKEE